MLDDLARSLRSLLAGEVDALAEERVYFDPPDAEFAPSLPAVNLFLYDVRENLELRVNDWDVTASDDGPSFRQRAPRRLDCSYLVTSWAGDPLSEHALLGQVLEALLRHPVLLGDAVRGRLSGQSLPTSAGQPSLLQGIGEFWQAMGNKPRAALNYTITLALDVFAPQTVDRVVAPVTRFQLIDPARPVGAPQFTMKQRDPPLLKNP